MAQNPGSLVQSCCLRLARKTKKLFKIHILTCSEGPGGASNFVFKQNQLLNMYSNSTCAHTMVYSSTQVTNWNVWTD